MDTPITALKWLLASDEKSDEYLREIEELNRERQTIVKSIAEKALMEANPHDGILFFVDSALEHGLIGLVAGKLTEAYHQPSIVLCEHVQDEGDLLYVASCRSPEWCNLIELLDAHKEFFVRYGGHRQAAGFSILQEKLEAFKDSIQKKFIELYGLQEHLPSRNISVECELDSALLTYETMGLIETFQPFGIGNPKPKFLLRDVTVQSVRPLGNSGEHLSIYLEENPEVKCVIWRCSDKAKDELVVGNIISIVVTLSKNIWNGKTSLQCTLEGIIKNEEI